MRRNTEYYGNRTSLLLTSETRGAPYKWISVFISVTYIFFGLRNVFFCGAKLPVGEGEDLIMDLWSNCQEDSDNGKAMAVFGGLHGLGDWLIAIVRFSMAMTASTSDLFFTTLLLALYSTGFMVACLRVGIMEVSLYYVANMAAGFVYETYVCYLAFIAYSKRHKFRGLQENETASVPFKVAFLGQAAGWTCYGIKMLLACDTPYILISTPAQMDFFQSTWHDCATHPKPDVRLGWATMAAVHALCLAGICIFNYWTPKMDSLKQGSAMMTFYSNGVAFLILRAGWGVVPPAFVAFTVVSVVYNTYVLYKSQVAIKAAENELAKED